VCASAPAAEHAVGGNGLRLALELERLDRLGDDGVPNQPESRIAEQDAERRGGLLEPRRDVDRVAGRQALSGRRVAGDDLARGERGAAEPAQLILQNLPEPTTFCELFLRGEGAFLQ
jgi:hypothetical protein